MASKHEEADSTAAQEDSASRLVSKKANAVHKLQTAASRTARDMPSSKRHLAVNLRPRFRWPTEESQVAALLQAILNVSKGERRNTSNSLAEMVPAMFANQQKQSMLEMQAPFPLYKQTCEAEGPGATISPQSEVRNSRNRHWKYKRKPAQS